LTSTDGLLGAGPTPALLADERRILGAINQVTYLYSIDRRNVMITGFSGGGFPTYFVGLRHPDVFSAIAARSCNFNRNNVEGWYPTEALETNIIVYWGDKESPTIAGQSQNAVEYLRSAGFQVESQEVTNAGHERHPEVAMRFWLKHWTGRQPPKATVNNVHKTGGRDLN
jgi:predicted esterase